MAKLIRVVTFLIPLLTSHIAHADLAAANQSLRAGDFTAAANEFQRLAEAGDASAQAQLGYLYYTGEGVPQSYTEAVRWYRKAAVQGDADAQYNLAVAYAFAEGVPQDYAEAASWYRRAAEQQHAIAQYSLGISYAYGEGVEQNAAEAVRWFQRAAEHGYVRAQVLVGSRYHTGDGVEQSFAEAAKWYRKAADRGNAAAQYNLGSLYRSGNGVAQDYNQAMRWYRMAADQGYAAAQNELNSLERTLTGIARKKSTPQNATSRSGPVTPPPTASSPPADTTTKPLLSVETDTLLELPVASSAAQTAVQAAPLPLTAEQDTPATPAGQPADEQTGTAADTSADSGTAQRKRRGFFARLFGKSPGPDADEPDAENAAASQDEAADAAPALTDRGADATAADEASAEQVVEVLTPPETNLDEAPANETLANAFLDSGDDLPPVAAADDDADSMETTAMTDDEMASRPRRMGFFSRLFGRGKAQAAEETVADTPLMATEEHALSAAPDAPDQPETQTALTHGIALTDEREDDVLLARAEALDEPAGMTEAPPAAMSEEAMLADATATDTVGDDAGDDSEITAEQSTRKAGVFARLFGRGKQPVPAEDAETAPTEVPGEEQVLSAISDESGQFETQKEQMLLAASDAPGQPDTESAAAGESASKAVPSAAVTPAEQTDTATETVQRKGFFSRLFGKKVDTDAATDNPPEDEAMAKDTTTNGATIDESLLQEEAAEQEKEKAGFFGRLFSREQSVGADPGLAGNDADSKTAQEQPAVESISADADVMQAAQAALKDRNYDEAFRAFRSMAGQGDAVAMYWVGSLYHQGLGTVQDHGEAARWYTRAAERGNADAQYSLGSMFLMGEGMTPDDEQAQYWYAKAAEQGHNTARHNLNSLEKVAREKRIPEEESDDAELLTGSGIGGETIINEAAETQAATTDATPSPTPEKKGFLSRLFGGKDKEDAEVTPPDEPADQTPASPELSAAVAELEQAFAARDEAPATPANSPEADYNNGLAYSLGDGVAQDETRAFAHFSDAAERGHTEAQYRLGIAYAYGEGTGQDLQQAARWYQKAAQKGHATAQRNLGLMYLHGDGVAENKSLALAWYSILADNGNPLDSRRRDELRAELGSDEIQEAERLQQEIQANIPR